MLTYTLYVSWWCSEYKVLLQSLQKSCKFKLFLSSTSESHGKLNFAGKSKIETGKVLHFIPKPINRQDTFYID